MSAHAVTCSTISQMLCAPAIGRAAGPRRVDAVEHVGQRRPVPHRSGHRPFDMVGQPCRPAHKLFPPGLVLSFTIMPNLKFALRTLFKTPFVTIVAIVSLALGIGANAAIFSLFNQMLLRAAAGAASRARLVNLGGAGAEAGIADLQPGRRLRRRSSATRCSAISRRSQTPFTGIAAHVIFGANLALADRRMSGAGHAGLGQLLPGARPARRRSAGCSTPDDDRVVGRVARRRAQLRLLADAVRRAIPAVARTRR